MAFCMKAAKAAGEHGNVGTQDVNNMLVAAFAALSDAAKAPFEKIAADEAKAANAVPTDRAVCCLVCLLVLSVN